MTGGSSPTTAADCRRRRASASLSAGRRFFFLSFFFLNLVVFFFIFVLFARVSRVTDPTTTATTLWPPHGPPWPPQPCTPTFFFCFSSDAIGRACRRVASVAWPAAVRRRLWFESNVDMKKKKWGKKNVRTTSLPRHCTSKVHLSMYRFQRDQSRWAARVELHGTIVSVLKKIFIYNGVLEKDIH